MSAMLGLNGLKARPTVAKGRAWSLYEYHMRVLLKERIMLANIAQKFSPYSGVLHHFVPILTSHTLPHFPESSSVSASFWVLCRIYQGIFHFFFRAVTLLLDHVFHIRNY
jgi:hypothetical protein